MLVVQYVVDVSLTLTRGSIASPHSYRLKCLSCSSCIGTKAPVEKNKIRAPSFASLILFVILQGIEEGSLEYLDNTDFMDTDIPFEVPVPEKQYLSVSSVCLTLRESLHVRFNYMHVCKYIRNVISPSSSKPPPPLFSNKPPFLEAKDK